MTLSPKTLPCVSETSVGLIVNKEDEARTLFKGVIAFMHRGPPAHVARVASKGCLCNLLGSSQHMEVTQLSLYLRGVNSTVCWDKSWFKEFYRTVQKKRVAIFFCKRLWTFKQGPTIKQILHGKSNCSWLLIAIAQIIFGRTTDLRINFLLFSVIDTNQNLMYLLILEKKPKQTDASHI